jgi:flagellar protein FlaG
MDVSSLTGPGAMSPGSGRAVPGTHVLEQRRLARAVASLNADGLFGESNELTFSRDSGTDRVVIKIVNRNTKEVVQQLPPEYVLRLADEARR